MRRQIPLAITFCVGTMLILAVFFPPTESWGEDFTVFFDIIAVFAFFLGGGNLLRVHVGKLKRRKEDWQYSIVTLAAFTLMLIIGLFKISYLDGQFTVALLKIGAEDAIRLPLTEPGTYFQNIFNHVIYPLSATMYSLLAFFVASASYRAFRAKNREATILLIAAFVILMGRTPFGVYITSWVPDWISVLKVDNLAIWIMNSPNLAGQRAIMIGIGLGVVSMSLRVLLGIERTYLGDDRG